MVITRPTVALNTSVRIADDSPLLSWLLVLQREPWQNEHWQRWKKRVK